MSLNRVLDIAASGMTAQSARLNTISSNMANAESVADTPEATYKARYPIFSAIKKQTDFDFSQEGVSSGYGVEVLGIYESGATPLKRYEPNHPLSDEEGYLHYPDINVVEQMADMLAASRAYQTNVDIMTTAKDMMQRVLSLGQ